MTHHVGGRLKIAPEHTERGPLDLMMKPGIGTHDRFKEMFDAVAKKAGRKAGKKYHLIPYFIAAHPGTTDEDMMNLAVWLKKNDYRADQVQTFLPSPMATATTMYHTEINPLQGVRRGGSEPVDAIKGMIPGAPLHQTSMSPTHRGLPARRRGGGRPPDLTDPDLWVRVSETWY